MEALSQEPFVPYKKALVVEDEPWVRRLIKRSLEPSFRVSTAMDCKLAESALRTERFDLILLDIGLPEGSGLQLCEKIKSDIYLRHASVILLTGLTSLEDRVNGLRLGADDYITKPFSPSELLARAEGSVRKSSINLEANPLTKLPGNGTIETELLKQIRSEKLFSALYLDIDNFKSFNDYYGFMKGDCVIRATGELLVRLVDTKTDLVGHIGGDDFMVVTNREDAEGLCRSILEEFDQMAPLFYDQEDRKNGCIKTTNRLGEQQAFPLISLSIGVATNKNRPLTSVGEIATTGTELKQFAKKHAGSFFAIERRSDPYPAPQKFMPSYSGYRQSPAPSK